MVEKNGDQETEHQRAVRKEQEAALRTGDSSDRPTPRRSLADQIDEMFTYHSPSGDQPNRYEAIRNGAKSLARTIVNLTPAGPDQTAAIRKLRECVMTANAAIALEGKL
jgi:hypothetical protein